MRKKWFTLVVLVLPLLFGLLPFTAAQDDAIILSLVMPGYQADQLDEVLLEYEAEHPGIKIHVVKADDNYFTPPQYDVAGHLDSAAIYVQKGDVLYLPSYSLTPEVTRAGFILDLMPLASADPSLNPNDFYPAAWESVQWDGGLWAIPAVADVNFLSYLPSAFDAVGLPYPDAGWTMQDFAMAVETLTQYDDEGEVSTPAFVDGSGTDNALLFRIFAGEDFVDDSVIPIEPDFSNPSLAEIVQTWYGFQDAGLFNWGRDVNYEQIPMRLDRSYGLSRYTLNAEEREGVVLSVSTVMSDGFGVSGGTLYPQESYELAKWLTSRLEVTTSMFTFSTARRPETMIGTPNEDTQINLGLEEDDIAFLTSALENAQPGTETLFGGYLNSAVNKMMESEGVLEAAAALEEIENDAHSALEMAASRQEEPLYVATPVPTPVLAQGEIALKFGYQIFSSEIPNKEEWDTALADFAAIDPEVGYVDIETSFGGAVEDTIEDFDCFYMPYNLVPSILPGQLLALDPFIDADPTFDKSDVLGNTLAQVQRNGQTYGFPITLQPQVLRYNVNAFNAAGVPLPEAGWTVEEFIDALRMLKANMGDDETPFVTMSYNTTYVYALMAAFGGLPIDYSTTPATLNFTDPATVDALNRLIELYEEGYINYEELVPDMGGGGGMFNPEVPIMEETLSNFMFAMPFGEEEITSRFTTYPQGSYVPMMYSVGAGHISPNSAYAGACYRLLSALASQPSLFQMMPARASLVNEPTFAAAQSPDMIEAYNQVAAALQDPNTVTLQTGGGSGAMGGFIIERWFLKAIDGYMLDGTDLLTNLEDAELLARAYQDCEANIQPFDANSGEDMEDYFRLYADCGISVDPSLADLFQFPEEE